MIAQSCAAIARGTGFAAPGSDALRKSPPVACSRSPLFGSRSLSGRCRSGRGWMRRRHRRASCGQKPGDVVTTDACTAACADTSTRSNAAICYSCRCKDALGDLPTPEELRCSTGDAIKTFRLEEGAEVEITGDATDSECTNPALLGD